MIRGKFISGDGDLSEVLSLRRRVFCDELGEPEQAVFDQLDGIAMHVAAFDGDGKTVAAGRGIMCGAYCKIGFICVDKKQRGSEYGDFIVRMLCDRAFSCGAKTVRVGAREGAVGFYKKLGFEFSAGGVFKKDKNGISVTEMEITADRLFSDCRKCSGH